jgi:hypothetical protein
MGKLIFFGKMHWRGRHKPSILLLPFLIQAKQSVGGYQCRTWKVRLPVTAPFQHVPVI